LRKLDCCANKANFRGPKRVYVLRLIRIVSIPSDYSFSRIGQYPYYGASVGATNGGMIAPAGASAAAAAFYPYLNMAEDGHGLEERNNMLPVQGATLINQKGVKEWDTLDSATTGIGLWKVIKTL
ncbi:hypothetical protein Tco_1399296, partial [Tanacetum coccineum]